MRLAHQTFLLLLAAVLVTVGALATLFAFNLERGFVAYVNARQIEQLDRLEGTLSAAIRPSGSLDAIRRDPRIWRRLVAESTPRSTGESAPPPTAPPNDAPDSPGGAGPAPADEAPLHRPPPRGFGPRDPPPRGDGRAPPFEPRGPRPPPAANDPLGISTRFELLDADHAPVLASRPPPRNALAPIERPITVDGRTVAWVRSWPLQHVDRPEDVAFLQSQYVRIAWTAGGLALLMAGVAPLFARRMTGPLRTIAAATERIAKGEFGVRLASDRRDEIGSLVRNVDAMAQSLAGLEQSRRRWIADISHELRTPLTVLQGELEALADGVRPLAKPAIASLQEETRHLARLVNDLHQLALADLGALPCTMASADLKAIAQRIAERYRERALRKGLELQLVAPPLPVPIHGDAQRIEQLLANLIENSVRYTDAPGRIVVRVLVRDGSSVLVVEDSAPGVSADAVPRLFDPLFRADAARSRASGGSGLGLAIARAIVMAHSGEIHAAPSSLGGLAITATFPHRS